MNKIMITGRLTAEPELKTVGSGIEMTEISVAVDRRVGKDKEKKTDFFNCVAWRGTAAFICKYFHKGDGIVISGAMQNDPYEDKETGKKRPSWKLAIEDVEFPMAKRSDNTSTGTGSFVDVPAPEDDGDLPF